jgi:hypothetical protein
MEGKEWAHQERKKLAEDGFISVGLNLLRIISER